MSVDMHSLSKRVANIKDEMPKQRKRSRTGGSKDLYDGHSQDVMLAKTLIDPDHQCSVTTVKAYVTHVCAWFRFCRTLAEPNYTLVSEEKLSGFLTWATQTPRLPCKTSAASSSGGSMSYQSARRYVEGGILALWRRYKKADDENPLHALGYLNTKYAIREATASERPRSQPEHHYSALAVSHEQEEMLVRALFSSDSDAGASIRAWAFYCLGASTWIPGPRRLHLRLESLTMALRTDSRLVEHTTIPFLEFRVSPDPASQTARFAEVSIARHISPMACPWYAISLLVFLQWQAQPSAMAAASLYDVNTWLNQPLFLANTDDSLVFLPDDARVQMVMDEISPLLAHATAKLGASPDSHVIRARDKMMAESLGLSAPQVVRLEKWRVHHRRQGVTRQQTFFDLTLVLGGQNPPPAHTEAPHAFRSPARTRLQVPDHLLAQVFPWLSDDPPAYPGAYHAPSAGSRGGASLVPSGATFVTRQRSHSMSASANSEDLARAERNANLRLMRELATVLLQDTAALMADPQYAPLLEAHPLFQAPLFSSRAFRDFCTYASQALSLQHTEIYTPNPYMAMPPRTLHAAPQHPGVAPLSSRKRMNSQPPPLQHTFSVPHSMHSFATPQPTPGLSMLSPPHQPPPFSSGPSRTSMSSDSLFTLGKTDAPFMRGGSGASGASHRFPFVGRARRHTFEPIGEEDPVALAQANVAPPVHSEASQQQKQQQVHTAAAPFTPSVQHPVMPFNPMLLSQPLPFPPQLSATASQSSAAATSAGQSAAPMAFPQLAEESLGHEPSEPMSHNYLMQIIDYLAVYNHQQNGIDQSIGPCVASISPCNAASMQPFFHAGMAPPHQLAAGIAAGAQFPRLTSESSESTASPELPSTRNCSHSFSTPQYDPHSTTASSQFDASVVAAAAAAVAAAATATGSIPSLTPPSLLLSSPNSTATMPSSAAQPQRPVSMNGMSLGVDHSTHMSAYFNNAAAAAAAAAVAAASTAGGVGAGGSAMGHEYIDSSALSSSSATPPSMVLAQSKLMHHNISASSLSSSSPTPTPSSNSPGLYPASATGFSESNPPPSGRTVVDSNDIHLSIDPHKLQFKADNELFL
ncbi:hypothetical protein EV175_004457 [Coemansia sp. RSA 1933]|nr:hypothetical protein EV175_004457 [Coemansia sp. RSA 1933]